MAEPTEEQIAEWSSNMGGADTVEEARLTDSIGAVYGGDYRIKLLMHLISEGEIDMQEAENALRWTEPSDSPEKFVGLIAGEFSASSREISKALEGTEYEIDMKDIEAEGRAASTYFEQIRNAGGNVLQAFEGYMTAPTDLAGGAIRSVVGIEGGLNTGGLSLKEDSRFKYFADDATARRRERGNVAHEIRAELDRLVDTGYLSASDRTRLKSKHSGKYGYENYQAILDALAPLYDEMKADGGLDREEILTNNAMMQKIRAEQGFAESEEAFAARQGGAVGTEEGAGALDEDDVQTVPGGEDVAYVDGAYDPYDFESDLYGDGIYYGSQEAQTLARARYAARDSMGRIIDADFVVDRSTGQAYSIDEWTLIKTDPQVRAKYEATKVTAPAIQEILNKPFFKDQYIQSQQNDMVGNISGESGAYGAYWSDLDNVREWQRLQGQKTGGPQIEMDPFVPSPSITNPWEADTFDFKKGQASADWMSMTTRERSMRQKLMKDNGLISDKEWANMGGNMYGTTGIAVPMQSSPFDLQLMNIWEDAYAMSSTFQMDPLTALGVMGDAKARSAAPTRGYGSAPKYSVPASLREVPDYKALATESRSVFRQKVGRDLEDWELALLSDELGDSYKNRNDQLIKLHRSAWDDAVAGGTMEVDYGEVEDPNKSLQFDIEEDYANELDRQERVEDRSLSRNLMMDSITTGRRMIG
jgi:hypothetical protein